MENKGKYKAICENVLPIIKELQGLIKKYGAKERINLYLALDGTFRMDGGFKGWEFQNYGGEPQIRYNYSELMSLKKGAGNGCSGETEID